MAELEEVETQIAVEDGRIAGTYGGQDFYGALGLMGNTRTTVEDATKKIRHLMSQGGEGTVAIGLQLLEVREVLKADGDDENAFKGNFKKWIATEFGMSRSQVYSYIDAASLKGRDKLHVLPQTSLFLLGALVKSDQTVGEKVIAEIEKRLNAGPVKHKDVVAAINIAKGKTTPAKPAPAAIPATTKNAAKHYFGKHGAAKTKLLIEALKAELVEAEKAAKEGEKAKTKAAKLADAAAQRATKKSAKRAHIAEVKGLPAELVKSLAAKPDKTSASEPYVLEDV